ncbi:uncharacterized protein LOC658939 [Tribolium castaneum]|uniref:Mitochondrial assembly of ribosomal large subunit protein 1 n=1 Tax=Tribolium castaneum TaxID=7070 RepID=D6WL03_TRICA|nr:PREDICTED: uncharacterized protein LOC658939 [Tribolium castaneum]EFA03531.2 hypothetical protein TcasGA2_TC013534 [Tribolium castaneum]|eukprot:XP_008193662.1 PREDICTED: uncharacterized protein LOC658939 [Tribolium castaneum]
MFVTRLLSKTRPQNQCLYLLQNCVQRRLKSGKSTKTQPPDTSQSTTKTPLGEMSSKYQIFRDEDSEVILDIYEDRSKYANPVNAIEEEEPDPFVGLNLERGVNGVYNIEDLIEVLHSENAEDIFVAAVPKEIQYVEYICVVTGKSHKHMKAIAQFVRMIYKKKMHKTDLIPKLEGENSKDWLALDLGNIALHIFSREARTVYDLDSLWALGAKYDPECNKQDPVAEMLEKHSVYLEDLHPAR